MKKFLLILTAFFILIGIGLVFLRLEEPDTFAVLPDMLSGELRSLAKNWEEITFNPKGYYVFQTIPLSAARDGFDGKIEILLDEKLKNEKNIEDMAEKVDGDDIDDPKSGWKIAAIRLSGADNRKRGVQLLLLAVAHVTGRVDLYGDERPVFRVDERYQTNTGGEIYTDMFEVRGGRLVDLPFALSNDYNPHLRSVESWKLTPARSGQGQDVLDQSYIQVDDDKAETSVDYTRCYFDGKKWMSNVKSVTIEAGYESLDGKFPAAKDFP